MLRRVVLLTLALGLSTTTTAHAFNALAHHNMTEDALRAEGFSEAALRAAQMFNFHVDLYEKLDEAPAAPYFFDIDDITTKSQALHFDSSTDLSDPQAIAAEWQRLRAVTRSLVELRLSQGDRIGALAAIGISLHAVQDFYSHTNWVEPRGPFLEGYASGPGWAQMGFHGTHPTWFDIPESTRMTAEVYGAHQNSPTNAPYRAPHERTHGSYGDAHFTNAHLHDYMHKDYSSRPYYTDAYVTAYHATRQWLRAIESWVGDGGAWTDLTSYDQHLALFEDEIARSQLRAAFYGTAWDGCQSSNDGGIEEAVAWADWASWTAQDQQARQLHAHFVTALDWMAVQGAATGDHPVPPSDPSQREVEFVRLRVVHFDLLDSLDLWSGGDMYARAHLDGLWTKSYYVHNADDSYFNGECGPFMFIKASPRSRRDMPLSLWLKDVDNDFPQDDDDTADISPIEGRGLALQYDKRTGAISGTVTGTDGYFMSTGAGENNRAHVEVILDTITPQPPLATMTALLAVL